MNVIIFGAGQGGKNYLRRTNNNVKCFVDNDVLLHGKSVLNVPVKKPDVLLSEEYDKIIIAVSAYTKVIQQLKDLNVPEWKIEVPNRYYLQSRMTWLKDFAGLIYKRGISGSVAEAGVYRGSYAALINEYFPDRMLYLFDTFEGFDDRDIMKETVPFSKTNDFSKTSVEVVLNNMINPDKCIIRKGWFPDTAYDIDDSFCFVHLDMDLYAPMFAGLNFFWNKMVQGGVLLVDDFYSENYKNVEAAVFDFEKCIGEQLKIVPNGDTKSMAIVK
ncbi:MAG: TylF/MycF family methyltransferase [Oscillospiraceae bacterium]|nr:TylF/MycF family methyltransferase [Oscillospiraceae bacterium]